MVISYFENPFVMKKILVVVSFLCVVFASKSQNLTIEGTAPNLYITHSVAPKENFYSVGRLYNQNPRTIASFNNVVMEKGLAIGQRIKIPLNDQNFDATKNGGETVALTHVVGKNESLSNIGTDLNVPVQAIKNWNNLNSDNIAPGTALIVGYLKMSASAGVAKKADIQKPAPQVKEESVTTVAPSSNEKKELPTITKQVEATATISTNETPARSEGLKETITKQVEKIEEPKKAETYSYTSTSSLGSIEGVFANIFTADAAQKSITIKSGEAATFKSTSGWQDKKYYILMNEVAPGTIVKIASSENKVVYAKVLGSMPEMKENNGLLLRISNAAASYLGIIDPKFPVQVSYY